MEKGSKIVAIDVKFETGYGRVWSGHETHLSNDVFAIDEGLEATDSSHVVQRKDILGLNGHQTVVLVGLHHYHLREREREKDLAEY